MSKNGRLRADELKPVQGTILLATAAADAYLELRADIVRTVGMAPVLSINGGYRSYADQVKLSGKGNHQYKPGNSVHGWGTCVDINNWQRIGPATLDRLAAARGFRRTIPTELWHYQFFGTTPSGGDVAPITVEEGDDDMKHLYVTDSVDGNGVPGWALLNTTTGGLVTLRADARGAQDNANSWARVWGNAAKCTRQDMLNAIAAIHQTR